jgi:hypothetical protein
MRTAGDDSPLHLYVRLWLVPHSSNYVSPRVVVVTNASALASTSMRRCGNSKNSILFQCKARQVELMQSLSRNSVFHHSARSCNIRKQNNAAGLLFRTLLRISGAKYSLEALAVTLTATLVLGLPQIAQAAALATQKRL